MQDLYICRICLATNVKMHNINTFNLNQYYSLVSSSEVYNDNLPQYVCYICSSMLNKFFQFHKKCENAQKILTECFLQYDETSIDFIRHVNQRSISSLQNLSVHNCPELYISYEDVSVKSELNEDSETKLEFEEQIDIKSDVGDYCDTQEFLMESQCKSDDDEPLAKHAKKKKRKKSKSPKVSEKVTKTKFYEDFATIVTLSIDEQLREIRSRKESLNYINSPYKCDKCFKGFLEDVSYKNHMARHDEKSGDHVCDICEIRCQSARKLRSHKVSAHERKYACRECSHVSNTCHQAREHQRWHQGHTYPCEICGQTFRKSTTRLTHVRLHHPTEFVCDICGESFIGALGLMMHRRRAHNEHAKASADLNNFCSSCDFQFVSKDAFNKHLFVSSKHSGDNDFSHHCRVCGCAYESKESLLSHYKSHAFHNVGDPVSAEGPVKCDQCGSQFSNAKTCSAHYRRMHLGVKYSAKKNVICEICGRKCTSNATLQYHQRTHTGEKPFQCASCPKRFTVRQRLQIHTRTHTDERPYSCQQCPKAFRHKPALNRHSRVHTGAKPYTCTYCRKSFSQSNSMKLHIHTVHFKLPPPYKSKRGVKLLNDDVIGHTQ